MPVSGRLRAVSGHLHDHGVALRLEDAATDDPIVTIRAHRDSVGRLLGMPYQVLAVRDLGPHLVAGRRYRLVATYDNPLSDPLPAVMGTLGGLFAPDDPLHWPAIDPGDPSFVQDRALLTTSHAGGGPAAPPCPRSDGDDAGRGKKGVAADPRLGLAASQDALQLAQQLPQPR